MTKASKIKGIIKAKQREITYVDNKTGEKVTAERGNMVVFKKGTDITYRNLGVQHYGKIIDGGNEKNYMVKFHKHLTKLVPRSKVVGWR
jgi:hypothetical protein